MRLRLIPVALLITLLFLTAGCRPGERNKNEIRNRVIKNSGVLSISKARGSLETLRIQGVRVKWVQFPAAPQLLEALHAGSIDIGERETPLPIFAQARAPRWCISEPGKPWPEAEAIVVHHDSPIHN